MDITFLSSLFPADDAANKSSELEMKFRKEPAPFKARGANPLWKAGVQGKGHVTRCPGKSSDHFS